MCSREQQLRPEELFVAAFPLARRAAEVRSANVLALFWGTALDREDFTQEALIGVLTALPRFDPARASLRTFVERVVASKFASLLRYCRAKKRLNRPNGKRAADSLQVLVTVEFRVDLRRVLSNLDSREQRVAQLLVACSPTEIARRLRISRAAVYRSIGRIRAALVEAGFGQ